MKYVLSVWTLCVGFEELKKKKPEQKNQNKKKT